MMCTKQHIMKAENEGLLLCTVSPWAIVAGVACEIKQGNGNDVQ